MARVLAGATLAVAGIVALIEAHSHRPVPDISKEFGGAHVLGILTLTRPGGAPPWSRTAYDFAHIGGTILVLTGALVMIVALLSLAGRPARG